ncbi:cobalt-factor II C(20)-methyltransferase [Methanocella sp. CWC-04]|uniref:Cobalt-factor II C(20)-methyltransferase n=1 Tax=Methanooceanicella nereidis TaxID=2052831 RepID=A0AAP2RDZ6_9EURY|nr:cobalt-factor II C(20)-methyltransferase [Methanocella sp. CWC-04]MCD1295402.1 cobalt-factor II C(20)-methyltransferase [Methanocella sp. CWC-04]
MLIGLGLGPGNPELLTLRAVRLLKDADKVFVPGKMAYDLVSPYCEAEILDFPMTSDEDRIRKCMEENLEKITPVGRNGLAVLGMIGDPNFYSTFWRLCAVMKDSYPDIEYRTEPGISSITAFASIAGVSVSGGFIVTDGGDPDSKIILKVRKPAETAAILREEGFKEFMLVERIFMDGQKVYSGDKLPESSDYFSIMYARR